MLGSWLQDIESLEAISQNDDARRIFLRMAALQQAGRLPSFLAEVQHDDELDEATKGQLTELASDESFLLAVAEYLATPSAFTELGYTSRPVRGRLAQLVRAPL